MRIRKTFKTDLREAITKANGDVSTIKTRNCSSDAYHGVEFKIYGLYIPVRAVIDCVAEHDGFAIESLSFINDTEEPYLSVFIANIPEQEHPAFIN